ncbi:phosphoribosylformylglycinamidine synthase subunit PurL [Chamaesiphon sp. GL140_3_metabinner_50]|uniref:phosphoribosylformylglycinamidine synthase subunit PurL n=1 Tax=Chamaesiphon sp. GL140_3_metabinner_50 TaxID=2970812 RepID=UPI0025D27B54|nr:phosphoribosylformylglycinamidine synthase subunit PurL [Chamaesiphon sp. GL140_3_metabinner_50]
MTPSPFTSAEIAAQGIKPNEYEEIVKRLNRHPNKAELGMFGVMWSEHCCYKNSRPLLKQFPTTGDRILVGPGENAGVIDLGDGLQLAFKIESHNHPSAVEPFQGAATGVGGILRDIFTMGARPIAILNSLRFGDLKDAKTRRLFTGVVAGISHYGNCLIGSETFTWKDDCGIHIDTIGNFVNTHLPPNVHTHELPPGIETLSLDPKTNRTCWQPVARIFKRQTNTLVNIRTSLGRSITVTPDHPMLRVEAENKVRIRYAQTLRVGDNLPVLQKLPESAAQTQSIDLIATIDPQLHANLDLLVKLPDTWQPTDLIRTTLELFEPSIQKRNHYFSTKTLPLDRFLNLEQLLGLDRALNFSRADLQIGQHGKDDWLPAIVQPNAAFARLLGYYLATGIVSPSGNIYRIFFNFSHQEAAAAEDTIEILQELGLEASAKQRTSGMAICVSSWLLGHLFISAWGCGNESTHKRIPDFVWEWNWQLQQELLKGLIRNNPTIPNPSYGAGARDKIFCSTSSRQLFDGIMLLIQNQGILPQVHHRPATVGKIKGREFDYAALWQIEMRHDWMHIRSATPAPQQEAGNVATKCVTDTMTTMATVKIHSIAAHTVETCDVYDVEVDNTHLFVTSGGIVAHNCVGVPTVGGEVYFDPAYSGNPLVNAMAMGLMETDTIVKSGAAGIGNPVLYVGSTTGRDGMGGASFASAELTAESIDNRPAVQVGDPFLEKSLIEACLEAFKTGAVVAAQDMGAAGITCSCSEMAAKGGVGIEFDLDLVPAREPGMVPYEYLLSESQERMLFVAHKGREQELIDIFERWGLHAVVAGTVIEEPIVRILFQGSIAAEVPASALADNTPIYEREVMSEAPAYAQTAWAWTPDRLPPATRQGIEINGKAHTWNDVLLTLLDTPSIASKRWVYRQYDHQVQNNTVMLPGGADAAIVRIRPLEPIQGRQSTINNPNLGVAATVDCNPRYVYLNPYEGAKMVVAEAARNLSCVGAEPVAVTDNLNFGSPEKPIGYWQLANACTGLSEACSAFSTPVTGGNVSLYNETFDPEGNPVPIYPTPVVGMVGIVDDITKVCGQGWQNSGDRIYLLGIPVGYFPFKTALLKTYPVADGLELLTLGASEYLATLHHTIAGQPPAVNFDLELKVQAACRDGIQHGWINSAHDCSEGGLAVALAECAIAGNKGAAILLGGIVDRFDTALFGEGGARIVVSISPAHQSEFEAYLAQQVGDAWQYLGTVGTQTDRFQMVSLGEPIVNLDLTTITDTWANAIERRLDV